MSLKRLIEKVVGAPLSAEEFAAVMETARDIRHAAPVTAYVWAGEMRGHVHGAALAFREGRCRLQQSFPVQMTVERAGMKNEPDGIRAQRRYSSWPQRHRHAQLRRIRRDATMAAA